LDLYHYEKYSGIKLSFRFVILLAGLFVNYSVTPSGTVGGRIIYKILDKSIGRYRFFVDIYMEWDHSLGPAPKPLLLMKILT